MLCNQGVIHNEHRRSNKTGDNVCRLDIINNYVDKDRKHIEVKPLFLKKLGLEKEKYRWI